jgi:hypothetical protein
LNDLGVASFAEPVTVACSITTARTADELGRRTNRRREYIPFVAADEGPDSRALSRDLEELRHWLFPNLPAPVGKARIERALAGSQDEVRWQRIERIANGRDLDAELLRSIRRRRT